MNVKILQSPGRVSAAISAVLTMALFIAAPALADIAHSAGPDGQRAAAEIPYEADLNNFPKELRKAVNHIDAARAQGIDAAARTKELNSALGTAKKLLDELQRGYHDELYHLIGLIYEQRGEPEKALHAYEQSLQRKASNAGVLFRHAYLLRHQNRCRQAVPELKQVAWMSDTYRSEVLYIAAECMLEEGRSAEAITTLEEAQRLKPSFVPAAKLLLELRQESLKSLTDPKQRSETEAKIMADLSNLVAADPKNHEASLMLARYLMERSDPFFDTASLNRAESLARQVVTESDFGNEQAIRLLFGTQLKKRDITGAEATLDKGLTKHPHSEALQSAAKQLEIEKAGSAQAQP